VFGIAEEGEEEAFAVADGYTCRAHLFEAVGFVGGGGLDGVHGVAFVENGEKRGLEGRGSLKMGFVF